MGKTGKQRDGRPGDRQRQNRQFRAIAGGMRLTQVQAEALRREVEKRNRELDENLGYGEVLDLARELFS